MVDPSVLKQKLNDKANERSAQKKIVYDSLNAAFETETLQKHFSEFFDMATTPPYQLWIAQKIFLFIEEKFKIISKTPMQEIETYIIKIQQTCQFLDESGQLLKKLPLPSQELHTLEVFLQKAFIVMCFCCQKIFSFFDNTESKPFKTPLLMKWFTFTVKAICGADSFAPNATTHQFILERCVPYFIAHTNKHLIFFQRYLKEKDFRWYHFLEPHHLCQALRNMQVYMPDKDKYTFVTNSLGIASEIAAQYKENKSEITSADESKLCVVFETAIFFAEEINKMQPGMIKPRQLASYHHDLVMYHNHPLHQSSSQQNLSLDHLQKTIEDGENTLKILKRTQDPLYIKQFLQIGTYYHFAAETVYQQSEFFRLNNPSVKSNFYLKKFIYICYKKFIEHPLSQQEMNKITDQYQHFEADKVNWETAHRRDQRFDKKHVLYEKISNFIKQSNGLVADIATLRRLLQNEKTVLAQNLPPALQWALQSGVVPLYNEYEEDPSGVCWQDFLSSCVMQQ